MSWSLSVFLSICALSVAITVEHVLEFIVRRKDAETFYENSKKRRLPRSRS